jgi:hypothetical protein
MFGLMLTVAAVLMPVIGSGEGLVIFNETFESDSAGPLHSVALDSGYTWTPSTIMVDDGHTIDVGNSAYSEPGAGTTASNVPMLPFTRAPGWFYRATMVTEINHSYLSPGPTWPQNVSLLLTLHEAPSGGETEGQDWVQQASLALGGALGVQVDRGGQPPPPKNPGNEWWGWESGEGGPTGTDMLGKMSWMIEIHNDYTECFYDLHDGNGWQLRRHTDHVGGTEPMMTLQSVSFNTGGSSEEDPHPLTYVDSIKIEVIPEPATLGLMGLGGLLMLRRRR